ncbi:MAG TPA: hypothetical protein VIV35_01180 [Chitinophagaceae bacterium]
MSESQNPGDQHPPAENEIADYYEGVKKLEMEGYETGIRKARNALFVTAALVLLGEIISIAAAGIGYPPLTIAIIAVEVGVFIGLAFWTKTKPYSAIIAGLIVFILLWIISIIVASKAGKPIYSGIIVRIIIVSVLASALKSAKAWEDLKKNG